MQLKERYRPLKLKGNPRPPPNMNDAFLTKDFRDSKIPIKMD